jgi:hypothetical protein
MHSITFDYLNMSFVAINASNEPYSASSLSVNTKRFMEQIPVPYNCKNARQKMAWNTHFFEDGIIVKLPGKVLPQGVRTAMTNNSFFCLLVPVEGQSIRISVRIHIIIERVYLHMLVTIYEFLQL